MKIPKIISKPYKVKDYRFPLVLCVIALSVIGILAVGSAREQYQTRQLVGVLIGIVLMVIISLMDYVWILQFHWVLYAAVVISLFLVLIIGTTANGAKRWINLGFTTFQPSALAEILLILFFAKFLMDHTEDLNRARTLLIYAALSGIPLFLIVIEPNLSTTILTALVIVLLIYVAGLSYRVIGSILLVVIPCLVIFLVIAIQPNQPFLADYQQTRILAFLYPDEYSDDAAYQQNNSEMAIGSGQLNGKGLNNNTTASVKNGNFISEPQTDFIFAIIGEELGFVGSCVVVALLLLIVLQCILIGTRSQDLAGKLICCGVGGLIGFQSFINIGVATNILPNTGVPLPFVSYGLTSLVSLYIGIGFVLNVGLQPKKYQQGVRL